MYSYHGNFENAVQNFVWQMVAILFQPQQVKVNV